MSKCEASNSRQKYTCYMEGVDDSDRLINIYKAFIQTNKWWKTLLFHWFDIARVRAFASFQEYRKKHADVQELRRPDRYCQLDLANTLVRQLLKWKGVPLNLKSSRRIPLSQQLQRGNCENCYEERHVEVKTRTKCIACDTY